MTNKKPEVARLLTKHRLHHNLKQSEVAELIGYAASAVSSTEGGKIRPSANYIKSFIDGMGLERLEALELMDAAGMSTVAGSKSKAPGAAEKPKPEPEPELKPTNSEPEMSYQEAVCFYALQATLEKKMDDFTAQMILKILGAAE